MLQSDTTKELLSCSSAGGSYDKSSSSSSSSSSNSNNGSSSSNSVSSSSAISISFLPIGLSAFHLSLTCVLRSNQLMGHCFFYVLYDVLQDRATTYNLSTREHGPINPEPETQDGHRPAQPSLRTSRNHRNILIHLGIPGGV